MQTPHALGRSVRGLMSHRRPRSTAQSATRSEANKVKRKTKTRATPAERKRNQDEFRGLVRGYKFVERAYANSKRMAREGRGLF